MRDADAVAGKYPADDEWRGALWRAGEGGMFTALKVRDDQPLDDYCDPGWFAHPSGTQAWRVEPGHEAEVPVTVRAPAGEQVQDGKARVMQVRKPGSHSH